MCARVSVYVCGGVGVCMSLCERVSDECKLCQFMYGMNQGQIYLPVIHIGGPR